MFEFGRYGAAAASGASERGFYLQGFEGRHYTVSRISRPSLLIEYNAITLYGGIQADRLKDFQGLEKDGLIQRMSIVRAEAAGLSRPDIIVKGKT